MKKGMFYLLPLLALTQVATSTPHPQVDESTTLVSTGTERLREKPAAERVTAPTAEPNRVSAGSTDGRVLRMGRNNRLSTRNRNLIRRP